MIEKYLSIPYVDGGRSMEGLDCYGLLIRIREELGLTAPPDVGSITRHNVVGMQHRYSETVGQLEECQPEVGSIAGVFRNKALIHVGVVVSIDGRLSVLETNPKSGPRWLRVREFQDQYAKVIFYRDRHFPESS